MQIMSHQAIYEKVNQLITTELSQGVVPWKMPYSLNVPFLGTHKSVKGDRHYSGANAFITFLIANKRGYESNLWGTYKQWAEQGKQIRKGEKSIPILFFTKLEKKNEQGEIEAIPVWKYYNAFNESQCEGFKANNKGYAGEIMEAEAVVLNSPLKNIETIHGKPAYAPHADMLFMPKRESFLSSESYYSTLFHELAHATGHEARLNRECQKGIKNFGDHSYSKEELVAELASAYLQAATGVRNEIDQSASYCSGWLKSFNDDPKIFISAASLAQKASDFILCKTNL